MNKQHANNKSSAIQSFETNVFNGKIDNALADLIQILTLANTEGLHFSEAEEFSNYNISVINASCISGAIIQLFTNSDFKMDWQNYTLLINHKKTIHSLFRLSGLFGSSNICSYICNKYQQKSNKASKQSLSWLYKLLILTGLDELNKTMFNLLTVIDHKIATPFILSLLGSYVVISEQAHLNREKLLSFGPVVAQGTLDFKLSGLFAVAWMHTSYATRSDKHLFKGYLNQLMRNTLEENGLKQSDIAVNTKKSCDKKPKLLVLAEVFFASHAMGRCYRTHIYQLKQKFKVIVIATSDSIDEEAIAWFDDAILFSLAEKSINQIAQLIQDQKADMIYYPSIGMATWTVMLVTYRFAPIQIASLGHPATTLSNAIDYLLGPEFLLRYSDLYTEKPLFIDNKNDQSQKRIENITIPKAKVNHNPTHITIAVNAISFKLTPSFLLTCQKIQKTVQRDIQWVFFTNQIGLIHQQIAKDINFWLPNSIVPKGQDYQQYLTHLNQCDIALSPFPFGGSNSNVDLLILGIPLVYLTGEEAHSRTDELFYGTYNLTEGLACYSINEYITSAIKLIDDQEHRMNLSEKILKQPTNNFFYSEDSYCKMDVLNSFYQTYINA